MPRPRIPTKLRRLVIERAHERCEYCLIHQRYRSDSHQIDHIVALKHRGRTNSKNLALACALCNYYKGSDLSTIDPVSGVLTPLFNPRVETWEDHFELAGTTIVGRTAIGRATVELLRLNEAERLADRQLLIEAGLYIV
jgi:hypothetical protein